MFSPTASRHCAVPCLKVSSRALQKENIKPHIARNSGVYSEFFAKWIFFWRGKICGTNIDKLNNIKRQRKASSFI
jgi:hypothetical protein